MQSFRDRDMVFTFDDLNKNHAPPQFIFGKSQDCVVYYNLCFDEDIMFPKILRSNKIDRELHFQLQYNGWIFPLLHVYSRTKFWINKIQYVVEFSYLYEKQYIRKRILTFGRPQGKKTL